MAPGLISLPIMSSFLSLRIVGLLVVLLPTHIQAQSGSNILQFVDPLIGTSNGGDVFAGATFPFGMAKAGPDSVNDGQGGYATDGGKITGFSHMHDSGTGGVRMSHVPAPAFER